jgi:hypothetical protein
MMLTSVRTLNKIAVLLQTARYDYGLAVTTPAEYGGRVKLTVFPLTVESFKSVEDVYLCPSEE